MHELHIQRKASCTEFAQINRSTSFVLCLQMEAKVSTIIASVERQMYYNNNTAQHSLLRDEIKEIQWIF